MIKPSKQDKYDTFVEWLALHDIEFVAMTKGSLIQIYKDSRLVYRVWPTTEKWHDVKANTYKVGLVWIKTLLEGIYNE